MNRKPMLFIASLFVTAVTLTAPAAAADFHLSNLEYLGGFTVPLNEGLPDTQNFYGTDSHTSTGRLVYDATRDGLFIGNLANKAAEISIPAPVISSNLSDLNRATYLQPLFDPVDGRMSSIDPTPVNGQRIGGMLIFNRTLIVSAYSYYDGEGDVTSSHFTSGLDLAIANDITGPFRVGSVKPATAGGYMTLVPSEMQSLLGGAAVTGNGCLGIISRTSFGAGLVAFDPAQLRNETSVTGVTLIDYPSNHRPWEWDAAFNATSNLFNSATRLKGVFISGTSVVIAGQQGLGETCYKNDKPGCDNGGGYGVVGGQHVTGLWVYNVNDLNKVKNGQIEPWVVRPQAWYQLNLPFAGYAEIGGVAYDSSTRRLFISQLGVDHGHYGYARSPVIHVYRLRSSADTTAPSAPKNLSARHVS